MGEVRIIVSLEAQGWTGVRGDSFVAVGSRYAGARDYSRALHTSSFHPDGFLCARVSGELNVSAI